MMEQELAKMRDTLPRIWWALYVGCTEAGFTQEQSLSLVQTFCLTQCVGGVRPNNPGAKPPEEQ